MQISWELPKEKKGIITILDNKYEWLLPWWLENIKKNSDLPFAFFDLGMSENAKKKAQKLGYVFDLKDFVEYFEKFKIDPTQKKLFLNLMEEGFEDFRAKWFCKPIAMMKTPFEKTLFLDLDCQVLKPLDHIFKSLDKHDFAVCEETKIRHEILVKNMVRFQDEKTFNSGVIAYRHKSKIIESWAKESLQNSSYFLGDQDILSRVIYKNDFEPFILNPKWNQRVDSKTKNGYINHYVGGLNKIKLLKSLFKKNTN